MGPPPSRDVHRMMKHATRAIQKLTLSGSISSKTKAASTQHMQQRMQAQQQRHQEEEEYSNSMDFDPSSTAEGRGGGLGGDHDHCTAGSGRNEGMYARSGGDGYEQGGGFEEDSTGTGSEWHTHDGGEEEEEGGSTFPAGRVPVPRIESAPVLSQTEVGRDRGGYERGEGEGNGARGGGGV